MATERDNPLRGEYKPLHPPRTSCPSCRRIFVPTSREQQELERVGEIRRPCKSCNKLLVISLRSEGGLDVALDDTKSADDRAEVQKVESSEKGEVGLSTPPSHDVAPRRERIHLPRSLAKLNQAVRTADEKLGTALTAIGGMHACLEEIQAAQGKIFRAQLSERSHKAMQETVAACNRLEQLSRELETAAARIFEQVKSQLLSPDGLRASLDVYHDWLLERCGEEEQRVRLIERLPNLFDLIETEWQSLFASDGAISVRQETVALFDRLRQRMRQWQESVGLLPFPRPGDPFDPAQHELAGEVETEDDAKVDSIKEVIRSGYRWGGAGPLLRRAVVVRWVRRRSEHEEARTSLP